MTSLESFWIVISWCDLNSFVPKIRVTIKWSWCIRPIDLAVCKANLIEPTAWIFMDWLKQTSDETESVWACVEPGLTGLLCCHIDKQRTAPWSFNHSGFVTAAACYACWFALFLQAATSDQMRTKVTGRWSNRYTCTRFCLQSSGLLLHLTGWITQSCYWQVSAGSKCCCHGDNDKL